MPSGRGWAALGAAVALVILWVAFGERELLAAALFLAAATLAGVALVRMRSPRVDVHRRIAPENVHEGDRAVVEVTITSPTTLRNVIVDDTVGGLGTARFAAARIDAHTPLVARYEVLCRPRGVYQVGPATVAAGDPFGLAEAGGRAGLVDHLIVFPAVEELEGFPQVRGRDPSVQSNRPSYSPYGGEEFFTLREYQVGDDLRRVHWPSTAKRDELMIRQLEIPWQSRALIVFDPRSSSYGSPEAFEHAVRGAASVVRHLHEGGFSPHLWSGVPHGGAPTQIGYLAAMSSLATVQPVKLDLRRELFRLRQGDIGGGALYLLTGEPDEAILAGYRNLTRSFGRSTVLAVTDAGEASLAMIRRSGATTVVVEPGESWAAAWTRVTEAPWSTASAG